MQMRSHIRPPHCLTVMSLLGEDAAPACCPCRDLDLSNHHSVTTARQHPDSSINNNVSSDPTHLITGSPRPEGTAQITQTYATTKHSGPSQCDTPHTSTLPVYMLHLTVTDRQQCRQHGLQQQHMMVHTFRQPHSGNIQQVTLPAYNNVLGMLTPCTRTRNLLKIFCSNDATRLRCLHVTDVGHPTKCGLPGRPLRYIRLGGQWRHPLWHSSPCWVTRCRKTLDGHPNPSIRR